MRLTINGQEQQVTGVRTVRELLVHLGLGTAAVAVELNRRIVPRRLHETTHLNDGDGLELVTLVGGG